MSKTKKGKLIILVAPSGAGKTTIANRLLEDYPKIQFSISATTRAPRPDEVDGTNYFFLSEQEFQKKINDQLFLEWEMYNGNKYGTLQSEVDKLIKSGYFPLLDIEVKGALNIKKLYGSEAVAIFIKPPSIAALRTRLQKRGSENKSMIENRINRAREELQFADHFDFEVINDDLEVAYSEIKTIIKHFITAK